MHERHFIIEQEEFLDKYNHIRQPVPERKKKKKKKQNLIEISDEEYERVRPGPLLAMVTMPLEDISALIHGTYKNPSFHMANSTSFFNQCIYTDTKRKSFDVNSCFDSQTIIDREISKTESKKLEEELIQRKAQNKQNSVDNWDFYCLIENPKLAKFAANNFFEVDDYLNQKNQMTNSKDKNGVPNLGQGDVDDYDPAAMDAPFQADDLSDIKPNQMNTTFNNKNNKGNMNLQKIDDKFSADKNGNDGFSTPKLDRVHHRGLNSKPSDQEVAPSNNAPNSQLSFLDTIKKYLPNENQLEVINNRDFRAITGGQDFVAYASVNIVLAGDLDKLDYAEDLKTKKIKCELNTGHARQNMLMYAAAKDIKNVPRAMFVEGAIEEVLGLDPDRYYVTMTASFGL